MQQFLNIAIRYYTSIGELTNVRVNLAWWHTLGHQHFTNHR